MTVTVAPAIAVGIGARRALRVAGGDRVPRPRLAEHWGRGAAGKLTRVSAPAGFGKTRLLAEWLLASELDGPDIARELVVSPNTTRTHTTNIYARPGVSIRRAAVRRAEGLDRLS